MTFLQSLLYIHDSYGCKLLQEDKQEAAFLVQIEIHAQLVAPYLHILFNNKQTKYQRAVNLSLIS